MNNAQRDYQEIQNIIETSATKAIAHQRLMTRANHCAKPGSIARFTCAAADVLKG